MESGLIDFNKIKEILGEDKNSMISFYDLFKEQTTIENTLLEKYLSEKNWTEVAAVAHKMKSSYGSIGSSEAAKMLARIESDCKASPDFDIISDLCSKYKNIFSIIIVEFDKYLMQ